MSLEGPKEGKKRCSEHLRRRERKSFSTRVVGSGGVD